MHFDMIKLKISFIADVLIDYTQRDQKLLCVMKKFMSQIELSPVTDFRYETKVGFLFMVGEATQLPCWFLGTTITDPKAKHGGLVALPVFSVLVEDPPPRNMNTF